VTTISPIANIAGDRLAEILDNLGDGFTGYLPDKTLHKGLTMRLRNSRAVSKPRSPIAIPVEPITPYVVAKVLRRAMNPIVAELPEGTIEAVGAIISEVGLEAAPAVIRQKIVDAIVAPNTEPDPVILEGLG